MGHFFIIFTILAYTSMSVGDELSPISKRSQTCTYSFTVPSESAIQCQGSDGAADELRGAVASLKQENRDIKKVVDEQKDALDKLKGQITSGNPSGFAAGSHYSHHGSTADYLCLPRNPDWKRNVNGHQNNAYVYGAEYQTSHYGGRDPFQKTNTHGQSIHDQDVPCTVCQVVGRGSVTTFPAWSHCPQGWTMEYQGYLMSNHHGFPSNKVSVCMDEAPEVLYGGSANQDGALFYNVETVCGSLSCPPYINGGELTCAVCTF